MNYRDFFKNKNVAKRDETLIPEGVDPKEFQMGVEDERGEHDGSDELAKKLARDHLKKDPKYYSKMKSVGLEQEEGSDMEEHCGACEDDLGSEYDDNGGLPKVGGALAVPHRGQPIMMGKIIQVGGIGGGPASGEQSGMTNAGGKGVSKDQGGVKAEQPGDKEPLTAGGKSTDSSVATKSVGGSVVPGEGQKQGGPNSQGTIADTAKMTESKEKVRKIVKEVLKEIRFNKETGKWVKINENTVDMKMGPSYKVVQPNLTQTAEKDLARTNQYDPEITEMYDEEEECMMNERYVELANAGRNLSEAELSELKTLREKIDMIAEKNWMKGAIDPSHKGYCTPMTKSTCTPHRKALAKRFKSGDLSENEVNMRMGPSYKTVQPTLAKTAEDDFARTNQYDPEVSEGCCEEEEQEECMDEAGGQAVQHSSYRTVDHGNLPQKKDQRWADDLDESGKPSKVAKTIAKGQKTKKTKKNPLLKFQKTKKTSSGVHKRKP